MVSTRSKTAQTHLDDYAIPKAAPKKPDQKDTTKNATPKKRKAPTSASNNPAPKRSKTLNSAAKSDSAQDDNQSTIIINRAPVLQLWSACVTHFLYPELPWSTCISAGSAISSICAVAKGRSIGAVSERDDSEAAQQKREQAKKAKKEFDEVQVMQFHLKLKDGLAIVGSEKKGKPANEELLEKKFGEDAYERAKKCFGDALGSWDGQAEDLNKEGFKMYEKFRPDVSKGQKGWGRKGGLSLDTVKSVIQKK